ncbi:putative ribonuclease H-like domain-containing protein [Tanacetum coccineum]
MVDIPDDIDLVDYDDEDPEEDPEEEPEVSFIGLDEFVNKPVVENCKAMGVFDSFGITKFSTHLKFGQSEDEPKVVRKNDDAPCIKEWVSDDEEEDVSQPKIDKKTVRPILVNTARQINATHSETIVNAARPMSYLSKTAHSTVKRPIHKNTTFKNSNNNQRVNTVRGKKFNTARLKAVVNAVKGNNFNAVKDSACWVWKPKHKVLDHVSKHNSALITLKSLIILMHKADPRNMSYLTDYEEIYGGYVAFGGNPKGEKITGKARTPQQNRVAKRRNMTLIEAARTMLADSKLPTTFWVEAVNTACYVQNRVLVVKPHNKTPYELFHGRTPTLSFMRPFGCPVTILNTIDHLGKFDGKADEGFFVGYSLNSKAFRVFNSRTRIVEENLHIRFSESTPNVVGSRPDWLFDIDALTRTMNYEPIVVDYILLPLWTADPPYSQDPKSSHDNGSKPSSDDEKKVDEDPRKESECNDQEKEDNVNNTNNVNAAGINKVNAVGGKTSIKLPFDLNMPALEDYSIFDFSRDDEDDGLVDDMNNLDTTIQVIPIPTTRIHKDRSLDQVIRDLQSATQIKKMSKNLEEHGFEEPKKIIHALKDPSWIEAMQEELLQFKLQEVWTLVDLLNGKRAIGSKWVFRNKNDERGTMIRNKARLVTQGCTQEEGINYDEAFAPVVRIKAIRLFLAYASFKDFVVYQMDVKSAFLYRKIEEEVYVCQPPGFEDPNFLDRVYKVEKALYGLHQAPRAWYETLSTYLLDNGFQRRKIDKTLIIKKYKGDILRVKQKKDGIFISQDKYVDEILQKFGSMIGSLMYLTSSRPNIMFAVCGCARYLVNPKVLHLHVVKRIFRYLKGQLKLGLWYLKDSPFDLVAYTDSDYARASLDRKSTTGGFQFLGCRLISWQCNKQTMVANSTTEAEYVAASSCYLLTKAFDFWSTVKAKTINGEEQLHALVDGKKIIITESSIRRDLQLAHEEGVDCLPNSTIFEQLTLMGKPKRKDTQVPQPSDPIENVIDEAVYKELGDSLVRATTTASTLEAEQDSDGGPRCQETMGDTIAQTRFESVSKHSNDSLFVRGNTLRSDEDRLKLDELMALWRIDAIIADEEITLVSVQNVDEEMFDVNVLDEVVEVINSAKLITDAAQVSAAGNIVSTAGDATTVSAATTTTATITTIDDITLAQALIEIKSRKPKEKEVVIQELCESTTTTSSQLSSQQSQEKGKGILIEPVKPIKKKDLIRLDEEVALKLQAKFDEEERLAREKAKKEKEANIALIKTCDDIQAKIDADH